MIKTNIVARVSGIVASGSTVSGTCRVHSSQGRLVANIAGCWRPVSAQDDSTYRF